MSVYTFIGWVGAISFIVAYGLLVLKKISADRPLYHWLNAIGGICLVINAVHLWDLPTVVVNLIWSGIAFWALLMLMRSKKSD